MGFSSFEVATLQVAGDGGSGLSASELEAAFSEPFKQSSPSKPPQNVGVGVQRLARAALGLLPKAGSENFVPVADEERSVVKRGGPNALPFEFRALEACLGAACGFLEKEVKRTLNGLFQSSGFQFKFPTVVFFLCFKF